MREQDVVDSRYRIERKLAAGGFGAIYAATDLVMGREVALKVLHRELASDELLVARFRREAEALARLRDPHTITMFDVGADTDGTPYIVLELLRGQTLYQEFLDHGALPWRRVATIARGVCSSLREAHAAGIIHRDLKPANIHLEVTALHRDHVKLLDFGIAKLVDAIDGASSLPDLTLAGQTVGTFDYMPPEQLVGGACTGKSDVFALAVVMYEMIAGQLPFGETSGPASKLMAMLTTLPTPLFDRATVPAELDMIVMRALAREPEDRPELEEIDAVLEALLDATALLARAPSHPNVAAEISSLIDEALAENEGVRAALGRAENDDGAFPDEDDGTFTDDTADTWVGSPPQLTTVGLGPTRAPASSAKPASAKPVPSTNAAPDLETLLKPLGKRELPARPSRDAEGTGKVTPRDAVGTPAPELHRNARESNADGSQQASRAAREQDSRFAVGSRTGIEPAKPTDAASTDTAKAGHFVLPARRVTPVQLPPPPPRRTPMPAAHSTTPVNSSPSPSSRGRESRDERAVDPLAATMSPTAGLEASAYDSQAQTARQPRRVITPPNGTMTTASSARAEIDRLAKLPQLPIVRMTSPSNAGVRAASSVATPHGPSSWTGGRPTPSERALPAPRLAPSGELPTVPSRMPTGTSPIANQPRRISIAKIAIWSLALFGVGFAAALAIGAL